MAHRPTNELVRSVATASLMALVVVAQPVAAAPPKPASSLTGNAGTTKSAPTSRDEAQAAFKEGTRLVGEARWAEALAAFERAQEALPHAITLYNVGVCERALGRYTAARSTFERTLEEDASGRTTLPARLREDVRGYQREIDGLLARVEIDVTPTGSRLAVDGRPVTFIPSASSKSPIAVAGLRPAGTGEAIPSGSFVLELDAGRHVLTFSRPGHSDGVVARDFRSGKAPPLRLSLDELPATIAITADQPGALVTVDGRDLGPVPLTVQRPAGPLRVIVEKDGFLASETTLDLRAGESASYRATLPIDEPSVVETWWFWTSAAAAVAGVAVGSYFLAREEPEPVRATIGGGTLGWRVPLP